MNLTLDQEDRRAVDLLLDRTATVAGNGQGQLVYASTDRAMGDRVAGAQRLLQLLELMPHVDPPQDLVTRTLRHIAAVDRQQGPMQSQMPQSLIDMYRQHA
jgi:hypothetical protein